MSSLSTIQENTPLSRAFFSNVNVDTIQKQIRYEVWQKSNEKYVIGEQDPTQLQIIMRSLYLQEGKNLLDDLLGQIRELNKSVIDFCVEQITVQLAQRESYLRDVEQGAQPMDRSINVSSRGEKVLKNKIGFQDDDDLPIGTYL
tara:strand:- start:2376 stop:2807 length:432 start_codon:yes stop_codon:yes gene_type:complete